MNLENGGGDEKHENLENLFSKQISFDRNSHKKTKLFTQFPFQSDTYWTHVGVYLFSKRFNKAV